MNGGNFTKLFASIVTSTIWREPDHVKVVWITMLAICDKHGNVRASVPGLAAVSNVSLEHCLDALEKFLSPDPWSRTKDFEGRRIEEVPGGWRLLNYTAKRDGLGEDGSGPSMTPEAIRQRRHRARDGQRDTRDSVTESDGGVTPSPSPSPSVSEEPEQRKTTEAPSTGKSPVQRREEFVAAHDWGRFKDAVDGLITSSRNPLAVIAELELYLTGELAHKKQTPEMLGYAVNQYLGAFAHEGFKTNLFAGVVRGVKRGVERHENAAANATETARLIEEKRAAEEREQEVRDRDMLADFERRHEARYLELKDHAEKKVAKLGRMTQQMRDVLIHDELISLVRHDSAQGEEEPDAS